MDSAMRATISGGSCIVSCLPMRPPKKAGQFSEQFCAKANLPILADVGWEKQHGGFFYALYIHGSQEVRR